MTESLTETITPFFDNADLEKFRDKNYKKEFLDNIEKETKKNRTSINVTFSNILKKKLAEEGISQDDFIRKRAKKFNSKLGIETDTKEVEVEEEEKKTDENKNFPKLKNPKLGSENLERPEIPFNAVAGSINSFFGAFVENLEELTESEKQDIGTCLNMSIGDFVNAHDKARQFLGVVGVLGVYGSKIKKARKKSKLEKEKKEKEKEKSLPAVITPADEKKFEENTAEYLSQKIVTDT